MRVLALDPGGTTGLAWANLHKGEQIVDCVRKGFEFWEAKRLPGDKGPLPFCVEGGTKQIPVGASEDAHAWKLLQFMTDVEPDVVVIEDFHLVPGGMGKSGQDNVTIPMRLIAKIDMMFWMINSELDLSVDEFMDVPILHKQMPGMKEIITDERLKRWGLWRTDKRQQGGPHAMDALRHLIVFGRRWSEGKVKV